MKKLVLGMHILDNKKMPVYDLSSSELGPVCIYTRESCLPHTRSAAELYKFGESGTIYCSYELVEFHLRYKDDIYVSALTMAYDPATFKYARNMAQYPWVKYKSIVDSPLMYDKLDMHYSSQENHGLYRQKWTGTDIVYVDLS